MVAENFFPKVLKVKVKGQLGKNGRCMYIMTIYPFSDTSLSLRINNKNQQHSVFHIFSMQTLYLRTELAGGVGRWDSGFSSVSMCVQTSETSPLI